MQAFLTKRKYLFIESIKKFFKFQHFWRNPCAFLSRNGYDWHSKNLMGTKIQKSGGSWHLVNQVIRCDFFWMEESRCLRVENRFGSVCCKVDLVMRSLRFLNFTTRRHPQFCTVVLFFIVFDPYCSKRVTHVCIQTTVVAATILTCILQCIEHGRSCLAKRNGVVGYNNVPFMRAVSVMHLPCNGNEARVSRRKERNSKTPGSSTREISWGT